MGNHIQKASWRIATKTVLTTKTVLLIAVLVMFLVPSQPTLADWPTEPDIPEQPGDSQTRPITVYEARQCLWYVEMYGLCRKQILEKDELIGEYQVQLDEVTDKAVKENERKRFWRTTAIGGTFAGMVFGLFVGIWAAQ